MYKRNLRKEKGIGNISNPARTQPHNRLGLGNEGTTALRYTSSERTLSDQTPTSEQHGRGAACVKAHDRFAAQKHAALTQALPPAHFSAMWGMCRCGLRETSKPETKTGASEITVDPDIRSPFRYRCVTCNGRMLLSDLLSRLPV